MSRHARLRSNVGRVAVPIDEPSIFPARRPNLVPEDVWNSWQKELATAEEDDAIELLDGDEVELVTSGANEVPGLAATTPADFEVALLALSQVKLFSKLDPDLLNGLAMQARQGELSSGDYLFREEAQAQSFYVVLDGTLEILRRTDGREVALRHIDRSEPVGLFGLLSGQRRAACARAIGDVVLLEIPAHALNAAVEMYEPLRDRVVRFFAERLLEGFVGSSKLFHDVDTIARARVIGRFAQRKLKAGEALCNPGEVSNALCIVISGQLILEERPTPGKQPRLFELYPGELVALTSAFSGLPCRMRVYAPEGAVVVMLGHKDLADLLRDYPALRALPLRLQASAQSLERDVWCAHTAVPGL